MVPSALSLSITKCSLGPIDLNRFVLREHKPCLAGGYYLKWTLTVQGKSCIDKCTNISSETKNIGLNKEINELILVLGLTSLSELVVLIKTVSSSSVYYH